MLLAVLLVVVPASFCCVSFLPAYFAPSSCVLEASFASLLEAVVVVVVVFVVLDPFAVQ